MPGELASPSDPLFRLGRAPKPLEWPPWHRVGDGRFDDPREHPRYRVLYAGERLACFYERLAEFRVDLDGVAHQGITLDWLARRRLGRFTLDDPGGRWLDLGSPITYADFRIRFRSELQQRGYADFDLSVATNQDRALSQRIGLWAREAGYNGIRYPTRHDPELNCWAIFEGVAFTIQDVAAQIAIDDPDLEAVAVSWGLPLPRSSGTVT